jgi:hypothetical protein
MGHYAEVALIGKGSFTGHGILHAGTVMPQLKISQYVVFIADLEMK